MGIEEDTGGGVGAELEISMILEADSSSLSVIKVNI